VTEPCRAFRGDFIGAGSTNHDDPRCGAGGRFECGSSLLDLRCGGNRRGAGAYWPSPRGPTAKSRRSSSENGKLRPSGKRARPRQTVASARGTFGLLILGVGRPSTEPRIDDMPFLVAPCHAGNSGRNSGRSIRIRRLVEEFLSGARACLHA